MGADAGKDFGAPATTLRHARPDAANSLRALVDRGLRRKVADANAADGSLLAAHVQGTGHEFWADGQAGFTPEQQKDLITYLLTFRPPREAADAL